MKKKLLSLMCIIIITLMSLSGCVGGGETPAPTTMPLTTTPAPTTTLAPTTTPAPTPPLDVMEKGWPMIHHDPKNSGDATNCAPSENKLLWKYDIGSVIPSSVVVEYGGVFFLEINKGRFVTCLDTTTGRLIWRHRLDANALSETTPVVAYERVYVPLVIKHYDSGTKEYSFENVLSCLDVRTGKELWASQLQSSPLVSSSPIATNDHIYIGVGDSEIDGYVECIDAFSGEVVWSTKVDGEVWHTVAVAGDMVYASTYNGSVYCLDRESGDIQWKRELWNPGMIGPLAFSNACIYVNGLDGSTGQLMCLDATTGDTKWTYDAGEGASVSHAALTDKFAFFATNISGGSHLFNCLDTKTHEILWSTDLGDTMGGFPAISKDNVYVCSYNEGMLLCLNSINGNIIWSYEIGKSSNYIPIIARDRIYIASVNEGVYCFG